jgi:hypothetical protein
MLRPCLWQSRLMNCARHVVLKMVTSREEWRAGLTVCQLSEAVHRCVAWG